MRLKKRVIPLLGFERLKTVARFHSIDADFRSIDSLVNALISCSELSLDDVLSSCGKQELLEICTALGCSTSSGTKDALIARISGDKIDGMNTAELRSYLYIDTPIELSKQDQQAVRDIFQHYYNEAPLFPLASVTTIDETLNMWLQSKPAWKQKLGRIATVLTSIALGKLPIDLPREDFITISALVRYFGNIYSVTPDFQTGRGSIDDAFIIQHGFDRLSRNTLRQIANLSE